MKFRLVVAVVFTTLLSCLLLFPASVFAQKAPRVMTGVRFDGDSLTAPTVISKVIEGGPADKAGLQIGDEILSVDDDFVVQAMDVMVLLKDKKPGDQVRLEMRRGTRVFFANLNLINHVRGDKIIQKDGKAVAAPTKDAIEGLLAPELRVSDWENWEGKKPPSIREMKGKVICMLLFQTTCENSIRFGVPQFKEVFDKYKNDDEVEFLAIQTPFFDYEENTLSNAAKFLKENSLEVPVGQDGDELQRSDTRESYKSPGTPWMVIIDQNNVVNFNLYDLPLEKATSIIDGLKKTNRESAEEGTKMERLKSPSKEDK